MNIKEAPVLKLSNLVPTDTLDYLKQVCKEESEKNTHWCTQFNRKYVHNHPSEVIKKLHQDWTELVTKTTGIELKPSYTFMSLYGRDGYCPPHFDRPQCQYSIDLQVNSDGTWPIFIKKEPYILGHGDAALYSGTYHFHYRRPMPKDMSFMHLLFFHYVPVDFQGSLD